MKGDFIPHTAEETIQITELPFPSCLLDRNDYALIVCNRQFLELVPENEWGCWTETYLNAGGGRSKAHNFYVSFKARTFQVVEGKTREGHILVQLISHKKLNVNSSQLRQKLEYQLAQKDAILSAIPDLIYRLNDRGIYLECRAYRKSDLLIPIEQVIGSSFWDMPESEDLKQKVWQKIQRALQTGKAQTIEYQRRNIKGDWQYYESRITRSGKNEVIYLVRNITARIKAQTELAASQKKWKSIVENGFDGILLIDRYGRIAYATPNTSRVFGIAAKKLIGQPALSLLPSAHISVLRFYKSLMQSHSTKGTIELNIVDGKGRERVLRSSWIARFEDPDIGALIINYRDITREKAYESEIRRSNINLNAIINNTNDAIWLMDANLELLSFNKVFSRLFREENGYNPGIGTKLFADLEMEESFSPVSRINDVFRTGKTSNFLFHMKNGRTTTTSLFPIRNSRGQVEAVSAFTTDITERYQYEQKLIEAKEGAEELARLKSTFLANMSHEIRTPLNGVLGLAELISLSESIEEIKEYAELQKESGERLLNTLTSILDLSRLEAEKNPLTLRIVPLDQLLEKTVKLFRIPFEKKDVLLNLELPFEEITCLGDETMLQQVFTNLLSNALKFTEKGEVHVLARVARKKGKNPVIEVEIRDTGIGISATFIPHVFDSFRQEMRSSERRWQGSGLGLSITKKYLKLLNGDISVESEKGSGSTFLVTLPLRKTV